MIVFKINSSTFVIMRNLPSSLCFRTVIKLVSLTSVYTDYNGKSSEMSWVAGEARLGFKFYRDNAEFMVLRVWQKSPGVKKFQTKADRRQLAGK